MPLSETDCSITDMTYEKEVGDDNYSVIGPPITPSASHGGYIFDQETFEIKFDGKEVEEDVYALW